MMGHVCMHEIGYYYCKLVLGNLINVFTMLIANFMKNALNDTVIQGRGLILYFCVCVPIIFTTVVEIVLKMIELKLGH